jgi:Tfp pilus assembly protein PilX
VGYDNDYIAALDGSTRGDFGKDAVAGDSNGVGLALASRGQYWIEVFAYNVAGASMGTSSSMAAPAPDASYPFVFRITARATGLKANSVSVLRTYYVPTPRAGI